MRHARQDLVARTRRVQSRETEAKPSSKRTCSHRTQKTMLASDASLLARRSFSYKRHQNFLKVKDNVGYERELILIPADVVGRDIVRMIVAKLRANRDELVRPPS